MVAPFCPLPTLLFVLALDGEGIRIATYGIELQHNMVSTQYSDKYLKDQCTFISLSVRCTLLH
jgi:hypothetical protein